jgi:hypothetical protein
MAGCGTPIMAFREIFRLENPPLAESAERGPSRRRFQLPVLGEPAFGPEQADQPRDARIRWRT